MTSDSGTASRANSETFNTASASRADGYANGRVERRRSRNGHSEAERSYRELLLGVLDRIGCAAAALDAHGNIVGMNSATHRLLRSHQSQEEDDRELGSQIHDIIHAAAVECARGCPWVAVERASARPIIMISITPAETDAGQLVLLVDLNTGSQPTSEALKRLFGLTTAEAKLAAGLAAGWSTSELAKRLKVSRSTIRSQLASVFTKTGTCRQGELVSLLSRISLLS